MNRKKIPIILVLVLALAVILLTSSALAKKPFTEQNIVIWELTKTKVIDTGKVENMNEGVFVTGYTLEAKAKSKGGNIIPDGTFRLTLSAFSPYEDMESQKAGYWYVMGNWTITKKGADPEMLKVKHNPDKVEGTLIAELSFNPTAIASGWTGKAVLPMALAAGSWSKGEGTLTLGANLEGDLFLSLETWPGAK